MKSQLSDPINPDYYKRDGLEAIDVIEAFFMHSPHLATAFKYLARMGEKPGNSLAQDAEKAKWYIDRWVKVMEQRETPRYKGEGDKTYRLDVTTGEWVEVEKSGGNG